MSWSRPEQFPRDSVQLGKAGVGIPWPWTAILALGSTRGRPRVGSPTEPPREGKPRRPVAALAIPRPSPWSPLTPGPGAAAPAPVYLSPDVGQCGPLPVPSPPARRCAAQVARRCMWPRQVTNGLPRRLLVLTRRLPHPRNTLSLCTPVWLVSTGQQHLQTRPWWWLQRPCHPPGSYCPTRRSGPGSVCPDRAVPTPFPSVSGWQCVSLRLALKEQGRASRRLGWAVLCLLAALRKKQARQCPQPGPAAAWAPARVLGLCPLCHFLAV